MSARIAYASDRTLHVGRLLFTRKTCAVVTYLTGCVEKTINSFQIQRILQFAIRGVMLWDLWNISRCLAHPNQPSSAENELLTFYAVYIVERGPVFLMTNIQVTYLRYR